MQTPPTLLQPDSLVTSPLDALMLGQAAPDTAIISSLLESSDMMILGYPVRRITLADLALLLQDGNYFAVGTKKDAEAIFLDAAKLIVLARYPSAREARQHYLAEAESRAWQMLESLDPSQAGELTEAASGYIQSMMSNRVDADPPPGAKSAPPGNV